MDKYLHLNIVRRSRPRSDLDKSNPMFNILANRRFLRLGNEFDSEANSGANLGLFLSISR
jgi:hypothetical protein